MQTGLVGELAVEGEGLTATASLGFVHRDVGGLQQRLGVLSVRGKARDADAAADLLLDRAHKRLAADAVEQALHRRVGRVRAHFGEHHQEFVATHARDQRIRSGRFHQSLRHGDQQRIAHRMAIAVVHFLEQVEVEDRDHYRLVTLGRDRNASHQFVLGMRAIGEAREPVVQREEFRAARQPPRVRGSRSRARRAARCHRRNRSPRSSTHADRRSG